MEKAAQFSRGEEPLILERLAELYAEAGRSNDALAAARTALDSARRKGDEAASQRLAELIRKIAR